MTRKAVSYRAFPAREWAELGTRVPEATSPHDDGPSPHFVRYQTNA